MMPKIDSEINSPLPSTSRANSGRPSFLKWVPIAIVVDNRVRTFVKP